MNMTANRSEQHAHYMRRCIELARQAVATHDAPVGALVVCHDDVIGEAVESVRARRDVTAHAEIDAIRAACDRLGTLDLSDCTLYTSVEPCVMCAYAIRLARIHTVVTGAPSGESSEALNGSTVLAAVNILPNRLTPTVVRDVLRDECEAMLRDAKRPG